MKAFELFGGFFSGGLALEQNITPGYVYHIKDSYFDVAQDDKLMRNHAKRPAALFEPPGKCQEIAKKRLTTEERCGIIVKLPEGRAPDARKREKRERFASIKRKGLDRGGMHLE
ncbi:MAG: hypothetical protein LBS96_09675, partial [Oscillospiraceae bacterium]|nr:hypothetical protein [Oscillospiraceae bacterium]